MTSADNRAATSEAVALPKQDETYVVTDLAATDEMPSLAVVPEPAYPRLPSSHSSPPDVVESTTGAPTSGEDGDSDVFVCRRSSPDLGPEAAAAAAPVSTQPLAPVTLFVYGWENVEPGPLSWVFPSLRAALDAVRTMRNAIEWSIVGGSEWTSIDAARAEGAVLVEQNV